MDWNDHFKRAVADETVRWARWGLLGLIAIALLSGFTYYWGAAIKHMVMAPFHAVAVKSHEIGVGTKAVVKGTVNSARDATGHVIDKAVDIKDDLSDKTKAARESIGEKYEGALERAPALIERAREETPAMIEKAKENIGAATDASIDKARAVSGSLRERYQNWRHKKEKTDEPVE